VVRVSDSNKSIGQRLAEDELERRKNSKESEIYFKTNKDIEGMDPTTRIDEIFRSGRSWE
jgi:adenylate cyclase class IV